MRPPIRFRRAALRDLTWRELGIRFAFGAGVSVLAGVVTLAAGPRAGGVLLASPATMLASLTLVAKEEGLRTARDEARGAILGAIGLVAFALAAHATLPRWPVVAAFAVATVAWALVAAGAYAVTRAVGWGGDEPRDARR